MKCIPKLILLMIFCAFSGTALAQVESCNSNLVEQIKSNVNKAVKKDQKNKLVRLLAGTSGADSIISTIENFLPGFQLTTLLGEGDSMDESDQVVFDYSFLLFGNENQDSNNAKIKLVFDRNPNVDSDIAKLAGDTMASTFSESLGSFDDVNYSFSYNLTNEKMGRSIQPHKATFKKLTDLAVAEMANENGSAVFNGFFDLFSDPRLLNAKLDGITPCNYSSSSQLTVEEKVVLKTRLERLMEDAAKATLDLANVSQDYHLEKFYRLVSNQPQLQISLNYRDRDPLVGADEFSAKVSYEFGFTNINTLTRRVNEDCDDLEAKCIARNYRAYLEGVRAADDLKSDHRFVLSLEYSDVDDLRFDPLNFFKKGGAKFTGSVGYGRSLTFSNDGTPTSRVDVLASFEDYSNNAEGNDRVLASITWTKKLKDGLSLPISLEYANKSEFLSDESTQLGAHIGLKYDFSGLFNQGM